MKTVWICKYLQKINVFREFERERKRIRKILCFLLFCYMIFHTHNVCAALLFILLLMHRDTNVHWLVYTLSPSSTFFVTFRVSHLLNPLESITCLMQICLNHFSWCFVFSIGTEYFGFGAFRRTVSGLYYLYIYIYKI